MSSTDYETNVDVDMANRDSMTIFINHRVYDYDGQFIGATGIGLTLATMNHIIDRYQARFQRNIYLSMAPAPWCWRARPCATGTATSAACLV